MANYLATAFHETARTMLPIKELGGEASFRRIYDPKGDRPATAKMLGNTVPGGGAKFCGRGYVRLTGGPNHRVAMGEPQHHGSLDLTATPDTAMVPDNAAPVMFLGMIEGWFTGEKLSDFFGPGKLPDPANSRRSINQGALQAYCPRQHVKIAHSPASQACNGRAVTLQNQL